MRNFGDRTMRPSLLTALYDDAARSFRLKAGATFNDLVEQLARIEAFDSRKLIAVRVTFDA